MRGDSNKTPSHDQKVNLAGLTQDATPLPLPCKTPHAQDTARLSRTPQDSAANELAATPNTHVKHDIGYTINTTRRPQTSGPTSLAIPFASP